MLDAVFAFLSVVPAVDCHPPFQICVYICCFEDNQSLFKRASVSDHVSHAMTLSLQLNMLHQLTGVPSSHQAESDDSDSDKFKVDLETVELNSDSG